MRLMTINKSKPMTTLEFYGCPMRCKHCSHMTRDRKDYTVDQVKKALLDYDTKIINFAGAEPSVQKGEVLVLIKDLKRLGKSIYLRTLGNDPDFLKDALPYVERFTVEMKAPLDDVAGLVELTNYDEVQARAHLERLQRSLDVLKGAQVEALVRVIPGFHDETKIERIAENVKDVVSEMHLHQFLSYPYDVGFGNVFDPAPSEEAMMALGAAARRHVKSVRVIGSGFDHYL